MRISIIIPTFNSQTVIRDCIESIPNDRNLEIIVVDDGSTDNTCSIVKEYNAIKLIRNKNNNGVSFARNRGLEAATGDFVMFLDSDDRFSKGFFDKIKIICYYLVVRQLCLITNSQICRCMCIRKCTYFFYAKKNKV